MLFITGYAESAAVGGGDLDAGMAVLTKPFAMDELARRMRSLLAMPAETAEKAGPGLIEPDA